MGTVCRWLGATVLACLGPLQYAHGRVHEHEEDHSLDSDDNVRDRAHVREHVRVMSQTHVERVFGLLQGG